MALTINLTSTKEERTFKLLEKFRGIKDEWSMLKGVLCASHGMSSHEHFQFEQIFDLMLIAARMDEIKQG